MHKPQSMKTCDVLEIRGNSVYINNKESDLILPPLKYTDSLPNSLKIPSLYELLEIPNNECPFCKMELFFDGSDDFSDDWGDSPLKSFGLLYCRNCRFWQWDYYFDEYEYIKEFRRYLNDGNPEPIQTACISKLREFDNDLPPFCSSEIAQYLRSNPEKWHSYESKRFEKLVADIFRANYKDAEVIHVGKPDDGGVDIVFVDTESKQWLVQVKRREKVSSSEGVSTIRNLLGAMILEEKVNGIIVSTADHFTLRAQQAAKKAEQRGLHIELIDKGILNRMLEPILSDRPWLDTIEKRDKNVADWFLLRVPSDNQLTLFPEDPFWEADLRSEANTRLPYNKHVDDFHAINDDIPF